MVSNPLFVFKEVIRSHLPAVETSEEELNEFLKNSPEFSPIQDQTQHPHYHSEPCKIFNQMSRLIKHAGLDQAKTLTNSVQVEDNLPKKLLDRVSKANEIMPQSDEIMKEILLESHVFDATQRKLPKNVAVPNINWNPVLDRMNRPLPYEDGSFSWGRKTRREYGIPKQRKK